MRDIWILQKEIFEGFIYQSSIDIKTYLQNANVDVEIFDYRAFKFDMVDGKELLYYKNQVVDKLPKVALARGNCYKLMHYLHNHGVKIINGFMNMVHMKDKWQTYLDLKDIVSQPKTIHSYHTIDYDNVVKEVGTPFIIKYRFGAQGKSVYLINNLDEYLDIVNKYNFDDLLQAKPLFLFQ